MKRSRIQHEKGFPEEALPEVVLKHRRVECRWSEVEDQPDPLTAACVELSNARDLLCCHPLTRCPMRSTSEASWKFSIPREHLKLTGGHILLILLLVPPRHLGDGDPKRA